MRRILTGELGVALNVIIRLDRVIQRNVRFLLDCPIKSDNDGGVGVPVKTGIKSGNDRFTIEDFSDHNEGR